MSILNEIEIYFETERKPICIRRMFLAGSTDLIGIMHISDYMVERDNLAQIKPGKERDFYTIIYHELKHLALRRETGYDYGFLYNIRKAGKNKRENLRARRVDEKIVEEQEKAWITMSSEMRKLIERVSSAERITFEEYKRMYRTK